MKMKNKRLGENIQNANSRTQRFKESFAMASTGILFVLFIDTYINLYATSVIYDLLQIATVVFFLISLFLENDSRQHIYVNALATVLLFNLFYCFAFFRDYSFVGKYSLLFMGFLPLFLAIFFMKVPYEQRKRIMSVAYILIIITIITTIKGLEENPYATKMMANPNFLTDEVLSKNIGGYQFVYMLVCMTPLIIYKIKNGSKNRWFFIVLYITIFYTVFASQYATAFVCVILFSIFCFFMVSKGKINVVLILFVMAIFTILVASGGITIVLTKIISVLPRSMNVLADRLASLVEYFSGKDTVGAATHRMQLYYDSVLAFFYSAGLGNTLFNSGYNVWGHSAILDVFGEMGLLGGVLLFYVINCGTKNTYGKLIDAEYRIYYKMSLISLLVISLLDPTIGFPAITMAAFLFPVLMYDKEIE